MRPSTVERVELVWPYGSRVGKRIGKAQNRLPCHGHSLFAVQSDEATGLTLPVLNRDRCRCEHSSRFEIPSLTRGPTQHQRD